MLGRKSLARRHEVNYTKKKKNLTVLNKNKASHKTNPMKWAGYENLVMASGGCN